MEVLKRGRKMVETKVITCEKCNSVIKVYRSDVNVTSQLGMLHDGMGAYNFNCPVCGTNNDFNYFDFE